MTYGGNLGFNSRQTLQRMRVPSLPLRFSRGAEAYAARRVFRCGGQTSRSSSFKSRVNLAAKPDHQLRCKMEQFTRRVEGQICGRETAATTRWRQVPGSAGSQQSDTI